MIAVFLLVVCPCFSLFCVDFAPVFLTSFALFFIISQLGVNAAFVADAALAVVDRGKTVEDDESRNGTFHAAFDRGDATYDDGGGVHGNGDGGDDAGLGALAAAIRREHSAEWDSHAADYIGLLPGSVYVKFNPRILPDIGGRTSDSGDGVDHNPASRRHAAAHSDVHDHDELGYGWKRVESDQFRRFMRVTPFVDSLIRAPTRGGSISGGSIGTLGLLRPPAERSTTACAATARAATTASAVIRATHSARPASRRPSTRPSPRRKVRSPETRIPSDAREQAHALAYVHPITAANVQKHKQPEANQSLHFVALKGAQTVATMISSPVNASQRSANRIGGDGSLAFDHFAFVDSRTDGGVDGTDGCSDNNNTMRLQSAGYPCLSTVSASNDRGGGDIAKPKFQRAVAVGALNGRRDASSGESPYLYDLDPISISDSDISIAQRNAIKLAQRRHLYLEDRRHAVAARQLRKVKQKTTRNADARRTAGVAFARGGAAGAGKRTRRDGDVDADRTYEIVHLETKHKRKFLVSRLNNRATRRSPDAPLASTASRVLGEDLCDALIRKITCEQSIA